MFTPSYSVAERKSLCNSVMARARTKLLAVRITEPMLRELDARGDTLQARYAWTTIRRTDVVRVLLLNALERVVPDAVPTEPVRAHHLLSVRVPSEIVDSLEKITQRLGAAVSRSDVVRALLARELAEGTEAES